MKDYKSLTCLEIKQILKKHNVSGYSKLCKQELVKLVKKTLNNRKIKKGGEPAPENNINARIELKAKLNKEEEDFYASLKGKLESHEIGRITFFLKQVLDKRNCKNYSLRKELLKEIDNIRRNQIYKEEEKLRDNKPRNNSIRISREKIEEINSLFTTIQTNIQNLFNIFSDFCDSLEKK